MSDELDDALQFVRKAKPIAIGITRVGDTYGLKINLASPPSPSIQLPSAVNGVPIKVEVTGPIVK